MQATHLGEKTLSELSEIKNIFPFESRFISIPIPADMGSNGTDGKGILHYIDEGEGEPIVFVHGNPTWSFYFRKVIELLKTDYRCVALDHMGCGLSEKPNGMQYRLQSRAEMLEQFLDQLGIRKCHLVVHDWGGAIGMAFATRNPDRVASVTITNTAAFPSEWISWRIQMCRLPIVGRFINYHLNGFVRAAMHMTTRKPLEPLVKRAYLLPYRKRKDRESVDQFVKDIPMDGNHPSYQELQRTGEELRHFNDSQFLILWGLKDFCFSDYFFEKWKQYFPTSQAVAFSDADHFLFEEKAKECAEHMKAHLSKNRIS